MSFIESVYAKLARHPKRIVFPEGHEERVLRAALRLAEMRVAAPIVLGRRADVEAKAKAAGIDIDPLVVIEPAQSSDFPRFCEHLEKMSRYRRMAVKEVAEIMSNPNYYGCMMLQHGLADALVGGASVVSSALLRPLFQLVKPLPNVRSVSSAMIVDLERKQFGEDGVLFLADCAVIPEPSVEQLAGIALATASLARQMLGKRPRVAMLSFSTKGSAKTPSAEKVLAATVLARQRADAEDMDIEIDGELQADTAILPEIARQKAPSSRVAGQANVLIFPDLNSGNIASKLIQHLTGAEAFGQILLGLSKPAAEVSRGATVDEIVGASAIVGLQAVEYNKLYGEGSQE
ncbi:MAG: phosphate acyltransferase [Verrucomicrobiales bacterium]